MKIKLLIIIGMIILIILSVTLTYLSRQMDVCSSSPQFLHNPQMNTIFDCLEFMYAYDPLEPDLRPSLLYDVGFFDLVLLEIILIVGGASGVILVITRRIRK